MEKTIVSEIISILTALGTLLTVYVMLRKDRRERDDKFSENQTELKQLKLDHSEYKKETKQRFEKIEDKISVKLEQIFSGISDMRVELRGVSKDAEYLKTTQKQQEREISEVKKGQ